MKKTMCVFGNDSRVLYISDFFNKNGYSVYKSADDYGKCDYAILLPNCDKSCYDELINGRENATVFVPKTDENLVGKLSRKQIKCINYMKFADFVSYNSYLTANAIIEISKNKGAVLQESSCLVTGYGYMAKALAKMLLENKANVDICARKKELKRQIEDRGYSYVDIGLLHSKEMSKYSYIYNTVPAVIIDGKAIDNVSGNCMIFDLASKPGGVDFNYCRQKNITADIYPGLPGIFYPNEAGNAISRAIIKRIE